MPEVSPGRRGRGARAAAGLRARLRGPGGYYNIGNALALATGLAVQVAQAAGARAFPDLVRGYLFGSPGAAALTAATAIFFVGGEVYHRAWARGFPPDARLTRWGDLISGIGAAALTVALACFGNLALALVSGGVLTLAKLGSAAAPSGSGGRLCRMAVLASRVPALAALGLQLAGSVEIGRTGAALWVPVVMLICNLLWVRADYLLLRDAPATGAGR